MSSSVKSSLIVFRFQYRPSLALQSFKPDSRQRIKKFYDLLLAPPMDHGLPVNTEDLTRHSRPVIAVQQLANWIHREARPNPEDELAGLRSELPSRWLAELRRVVAEAQSV
jgi:hypothetical protein